MTESIINAIFHEPLCLTVIGFGITLVILLAVVTPYLDESEYDKDIKQIPGIKSCFELTKMDRGISIDHWSKYRDLIENAINLKAGELKC